MTVLCFYFQAHQPRRLRKHPSLATPFDDALDEAVMQKVAANCYVPATRMLTELVREHPDFRLCFSLSGTLLEQGTRFHPETIAALRDLADAGRERGQVEFLAETYFHSLAGLFEDGARQEFRQQVKAQREMVESLLEVQTYCMRNTELLYNNTVAKVAAEMGFKAILCEPRSDVARDAVEGTVFRDRWDRITVLPRCRRLSDEIAFRFCQNPFSPEQFVDWVAESPGDVVLVGMDYESIGEHQWRETGIFEFWQGLPAAISQHPEVTTATPVQVAEKFDRGATIDVHELATSSWADQGRDTNAWLGNRAQQELFDRYRRLERPIRASGDPALLETWRHLGTSDNFYYMCTTRHSQDGQIHEYFSHFRDISEAIMAYTTVLTRLEMEVGGGPKAVQIRRLARRPRILLVTPEITELPEGFGNLANAISVKGGGLADISAALVGELLRLGLDIHVALPKYERQMLEHARISSAELDRLMGVVHSSKSVHLAQDSAFTHLSEVYEDSHENPALRRAIAFQRATINQIFHEAMPEHGKMLVHCNDWMTGLIPAAARAHGFQSVFTVHNIHSATTDLRTLDGSGIDVAKFWRDLHVSDRPHHGVPGHAQVDFLLSGIRAADFVNTVSATFLREVTRGFFPGIISEAVREELRAKCRVDRAGGILNAPNSSVDPHVSQFLVMNYGPSTVMAGKAANRAAFQERLGLALDPDAALFFWPHRLYPQKGPELWADTVPRLLAHHGGDGLQVAVVANGDQHWEQHFGALSMAYPGLVAYQHFDPELSELGKAAADVVVMPSLYEPCGLAQMEATRFGTLPIVRDTGGLSDSVEHLDMDKGTGNGFAFNDFDAEGLHWACRQAVAFHKRPAAARKAVLQRVMRESSERFSLRNTTINYVRVYERLLGEKLV